MLGAGGALAANLVLPGGDEVTTLGGTHTITGTGSSVLRLDSAPAGTNSLEYAFACLSAGTATFPDGSSAQCDTADPTRPASDNKPWKHGTGTFALRTTPDMKWRFTYSFSDRQPTDLATNASGQTYGVDGPNGHPDLIAAVAMNGRTGYISAKEEAAADPCGDVKTPAQAVKCTEDNSGKTFAIPVYESDGKTKIGVFQIGG